MRFRKSISICKGVKLNISKSGPSLTVGRKGVSFNVGSKGAYVNWSIPGTGIYDRVRVDTLVKDKLFGSKGAKDANQEGEEKASAGSMIESVLGGLLGVSGTQKKSTSKSTKSTSKTTSKTTSKSKQAEAPKADAPDEDVLEEIAQEEAFVAIAKAAPDVERKADGQTMKADQAEKAIEAWFGEAESPVPFEIQAECLADKKAVMVDLDLPEIEDMPNRKLTQLASGAVKVKEKSQKEQKEAYQTCVLGLGEYVAAHMLNILPSAEKIVVSAYTRRRNSKTGEAEEVFIYSVVFERNSFKKNYQKQEPLAFCGALRGRINVLASGVMKEIVPFEPEDV